MCSKKKKKNSPIKKYKSKWLTNITLSLFLLREVTQNSVKKMSKKLKRKNMNHRRLEGGGLMIALSAGG